MRWFLSSPGLLQASAETPAGQLISDAELTAIAQAHRSEIESLSHDPTALVEALEAAKKTNRLGRYLEALAEFVVARYLRPSRSQLNTPVREGRRTIGEMDFLFDAAGGVQHWELSVKFYICIADTPDERRESCFYMGTFVEDRLDRKIEHLFHHQLCLPQTEAAQNLLRAQGWAMPVTSRALMKGLFFYPSDSDWQRSELPPAISARHERGWWTTAKAMQIPALKAEPLYMQMGQLQWLSRYQGEVEREQLLNRVQLEQLITGYFGSELTPAWLRRRELTFAEVEVQSHINNSDRVVVREIARGHVVHQDWPRLARWAAEQKSDELEESRRKHSKRPV